MTLGELARQEGDWAVRYANELMVYSEPSDGQVDNPVTVIGINDVVKDLRKTGRMFEFAIFQ